MRIDSSLSGASVLSSATTSIGAARTAVVAPKGGLGDAARADISGPAKLMAELADLQKSDPDQFKAKLEQMASDLRSKADEVGGEESERMTALAGKFAEAAESGDLSVLKPPAEGSGYKVQSGKGHSGPPPAGPPPAGGPHGPPPAGGPPGAKGGASSTSSSNNDSEPADANGDGTVSAAEQLLYDLAHPVEDESEAAKGTTEPPATGEPK